MNTRERTEAQKIASRLNGAKSKGPTTPEGKARIGENAIKHGLHAQRVVMDNENPEAWDRFLDALNDEWQPETVTELELIHDIAAARWRLYRALDFETALMDLEVAKSYDAFKDFCPNGDTRMLNAVCWQALNKDGTLPAIHRQEVRLRRIIKESTTQLTSLKAARKKDAAQEPRQYERSAPAEEQSVQNKPEPVPQAPGQKVQNKPELRPMPVQSNPGKPSPTPSRSPEQRPSGPKAA